MPETPRGPEQFDAIYGAHVDAVFRYVAMLTGDHDEAADIAADTFERAFAAWTRGRLSEPRARPWLLLTARHLVVDRWRRIRRMMRPTPRRADPSADPFEVVASAAWIRSVAQILSARQREVIALRYLRDLSDAQIASIMGISESGVRSLAARAIDVLRRHPEVLDG